MVNKLQFSVSSYEYLIQIAKKKKYKFLLFKEVLSQKLNSPTLLLRHDIDFSLNHAWKMAKLEHKLDIKSTYFILLYNDFYNPLTPSSKEIIKNIKDMGHEIGIHWDSRNYRDESWKKKFKRDLQILSDIIREPILSGSQHEPASTSLIKISKLLKFEAYSSNFKKFIYTSDSSMTWRKYTPLDLLENQLNFQFLAHPFWWMTPGRTMHQKFDSFFLETTKENKQRMFNYCKKTKEFLRNRKKLDENFMLNRQNVD